MAQPVTSSSTQSPGQGGTFAFGLTPPEVERLRLILQRETGRNITSEEAWARAIELIALFRMLLGRLPEDA